MGNRLGCGCVRHFVIWWRNYLFSCSSECWFWFGEFLMRSRICLKCFSCAVYLKLYETRVSLLFFQKCQTFFLHLEHAFDSGLCKNFSDYLSIQLKCVCVFCFILGCLKISLLVNSVITFQWTNGLTISAASRYGRLLLVCRLLTLCDWYLGNFNELKRRSKKACTIVHGHVQKLFDNKQSVKIGQNTTKCFLFKNYHMPGTVG